MRTASRLNSVPRGITLVELLVVITIMMLLAAVTVPALQPMMASRQIREAARATNVFFGAAREHAREMGRPHGVWIERWDVQRQGATTLFQAEIPPPYAGEALNSTVMMTRLSESGGFAYFRVSVPTPADFNHALIRIGDRMQVNFQGPWYEITGTDANSDGVADADVNSDGILDAVPFLATVDLRQGGQVPWTQAGSPWGPMPFRIMRQPVKSSVAPLSLPGTTVIDLYESGTGTRMFEPRNADDSKPVIVMFSPNGGIDRIYCRELHWNSDGSSSTFLNWTEIHPTAPVYFLIGRRDRLAASVKTITSGAPDPAPDSPLAEDGLRNWQDLNNLWVTIQPQTGLVATTENAYGDVTALPATYQPPTTFDYSTRPHRFWAFSVARGYAARGQSMGGR